MLRLAAGAALPRMTIELSCHESTLGGTQAGFGLALLHE